MYDKQAAARIQAAEFSEHTDTRLFLGCPSIVLSKLTLSCFLRVQRVQQTNGLS
jgi:hypothetical protein